ncbi:MAG: phage integrase SAM-like domain-containing protein [Alistipes sp.]|nr:phage integrase SAM-like domain-containing protein [Alistipes sp.]
MSAEIRISIRVEAADIVSATNNKINVILLKDEKSQDYVPQGSQSPKPSKKIYSRATTIPQKPTELLQFKIQEMESGTNRNNGRKFSQSTIQQWKNFHRLLCRYEQSYGAIDFREINTAFWDRFKQFCEDEGLMHKSTNKYLAVFRALISYAQANGIEVSETALQSYHKVPIFDDDSKAKTYLNEQELQALYEMKLSGMKERVRDIFMLGCYLGQRVSDYNNLTKSDFTTTRRGNRVVSFTQEKTNNAVVVPIIYDNVYSIAEKYNYNFPRLSHSVINRYIKRILADLSTTLPSLRQTLRTAITLKEQQAEARGTMHFERDAKGYVVKPRYEMVSTHTARRSCITNLYLSNRFTISQLMSISGHKSEKAFNEYICCSSEEIADVIAEIAKKSKTEHDLF